MSARVSLKSALAQWPGRRWQAAAAAAALTYLVIAVPTELIDTPLFSREIPPTWWSFPVLGITAALTGLVVATYVARIPAPAAEGKERLGAAGTIVSFFAVGCPVCNKLVLLALGSSGAVQYFEPLQPLLAVGSISLLLWAFLKRATSEDRCPVPQPQTAAATPAEG
ncbi:hypothetical protein QMY03_09035 [Arthrobacter sp. KFRI-F3372]|uniref:hypothetical protein n=1 Tax=Micrococcaceae TaxID=1268 RepID=UPI002780B893|nr:MULTISPECIES: hypothetical protein [Micrococcaceae]MDP9988362.1 hypothetical protein [Arthrobacter oryzae]MEE2523860.1 hypothetical protein [Pseudarthrobacter sp. J47]MEE2530290.1 hypothetical protein [Pseudarthrobacter sp. J75]WHP61030.1 hypothetical protein QMY03_09035 [Arthrobacter sp. KFRI-F3372]